MTEHQTTTPTSTPGSEPEGSEPAPAAVPAVAEKKARKGKGEGEARPTVQQLTEVQRNSMILPGDAMVREGMNWFVLRVASNKESAVRDTLLRKVQIESMGHLVGRILVPTEKSRVVKNGKSKTIETKLYPGYCFVEMKLEDDGRIPQDVFFLIKETTGVGDFVGTKGRPTPMKTHEIEKMQAASMRVEDQPQIKLVFVKGENVNITDGPFQGFEGTVDELLPEKGLVRVLVTIFGRQAPVELQEWQLAKPENT
jgi:transcriptional antiterminator NusG